MLWDWASPFAWLHSALYIFSPDYVADALGLSPVLAEYRGWLALAIPIGLSFPIAVFIAGAYRWLLRRYWWQAKAIKHLDTLCGKENSLLRYCLYRDRRTIYINATHPVVRSLTHKDLLRKAPGPKNITCIWPFTVYAFVWKKLKEKKACWLAPEVIESECFQERVRAFEEKEKQDTRLGDSDPAGPIPLQ